MKLSIIIVNYNVKYFLQQCLHSVFDALKGIDAEVFVVDNNSVDGSVSMIKSQFPQVKLIANTENLGFSKANNQAIAQAKGEYILLLNPDTIVEETTFNKTIEFMDQHPNAGALGVKMIDGKGKFLPESKRGLPTPIVSFYKMIGLTRLFPHSKTFARYYLGHLDNDQTHKVEVLSGAFMLIRKKVLDQIGFLDESFFMYGEDIDLSYRILQAGYDNYYFAETKIIHYKGESTKKGSLNYVFIFYNAMLIFIQKHFSNRKNKFFIALLRLSVVFYATMSAIKRLLIKMFLPLFDFISIMALYFLITPIWQHYVLDHVIYPPKIWFQFAAYTAIWQIVGYIIGIYDKPLKLKTIPISITLGTLIILLIYSLLPLQFRFSRALILIGAFFALFSMYLGRLIFFLLRKFTNYDIYTTDKIRVLVIANAYEYSRITDLLNKIYTNAQIIGYVSDDETDNNKIGKLQEINEIIKINKPNEVVFGAKDITNKNLIDLLLVFSQYNINVKIAPRESHSIIGSNTIKTLEDLYIMDFNTINKPTNRRLKRLLDISASLIFLVFSFILIFTVKNPLKMFKNIFNVLIGKYSWIGIFSHNQQQLNKLQSKFRGIITPADVIHQNITDENLKTQINLKYAKDYSITTDIYLLIRALRKIDK